MGEPNFSAELKRDAVAQVTERCYPVADVSQLLGGSPHSRICRHLPASPFGSPHMPSPRSNRRVLNLACHQ